MWPLPDDYDAKHYESESSLSNIVKIQSFLRQVAVTQHYNLILKLHRKRTRVAKEIWNSETTYLEGLLTMYQFFYLPLQKISKEANAFVTEDQVKLLFGNLQTLMDQAKKMNTMLAKVVTSYTAHSKLGHIFTENAEGLKAAFTPYVDPFDEANALFLSLRKDNDRFREWLSAIEFKTVDLGLESYLIMPIQRVTRYGLLLRELIHQTWQDHEDYEPLNAALSAVEEVASHVNGHKKKVIMQQKIKSIFSAIVGIPEIPSNEERLYITEGPVTDLGDSIPVTHHIFLFSDLMLWTQMINKKKFMFRKMNWLKDSTAEAVEKSNSFRVITNDWITTVFTKTKEDQNKWLAYLENENFTLSSEPAQPKRPDAIFLSRKKTVEEALKRGGMKRRNAGSHLNKMGSKSSARHGSTKREKGVEGDEKDKPKKASGGGAGSDGKSDKTRKIPRGYATIDPKMLEEVKAAKEQLAGKEGSTRSSKEAKADGHVKSGSGGSSKVKERDPHKMLTKKPKKGETITPELLEALRATRNMTEAEQQVYLAKLQKDGHASLPPSSAPDGSGLALASSSSVKVSSVSGGSDGASESDRDSGDATSSASSKRATTIAASSSSASWHKGPPPPMPDVSHVKRGSVSVSSDSGSPSAFGSRIRTSTNLSAGTPEPMSKPRGSSVSVASSSARSSASYAEAPRSTTPELPSSSNGASSSTQAMAAGSSTAAPRPTRQVPIAKRSSTESLTDAAKRRSGSVTVVSKTNIM
jgi:hypothetical protein